MAYDVEIHIDSNFFDTFVSVKRVPLLPFDADTWLTQYDFKNGSQHEVEHVFGSGEYPTWVVGARIHREIKHPGRSSKLQLCESFMMKNMFKTSVLKRRLGKNASLTEKTNPIWIARALSKCSGCRKCEIACSLHHENRIWPEASRVRVFMLVPGADFPHLCTQCKDYPCVEACPFEALSISDKTSAVLVNTDQCTGCGKCIEACPGRIPHIHPTSQKILICDLCDGDPQCVKVCQEGGWGVLETVERREHPYKLYARTPEETTRNLAIKLYGEKAKEFL